MAVSSRNDLLTPLRTAPLPTLFPYADGTYAFYPSRRTKGYLLTAEQADVLSRSSWSIKLQRPVIRHLIGLSAMMILIPLLVLYPERGERLLFALTVMLPAVRLIVGHVTLRTLRSRFGELRLCVHPFPKRYDLLRHAAHPKNSPRRVAFGLALFAVPWTAFTARAVYVFVGDGHYWFGASVILLYGYTFSVCVIGARVLLFHLKFKHRYGRWAKASDLHDIDPASGDLPAST